MSVFFKQDPHIVEKIWGGEKLSYKTKKKNQQPIGEAWELSALPMGQSQFSGKPLESILNPNIQLKILIKILDTLDNLSVQVHPNDSLAAKLENSTGKTECWYILAAENNAQIYLGLKEGVTKEQLQESIESGEQAHLLMNGVEAKPGRFFFVPAGQLHAIGKGITLIEIQQSSGITYRLWDWNRLGLDGKPRELHIEKGLEALKMLPTDYKDIKENAGTLVTLIENEFFSVFLGAFEQDQQLLLEMNFEYGGVTCLEGELLLYNKDDVVILKSWETAFVKNDHTSKIKIASTKGAKFVFSHQV